ncbi:MAG: hypothetical protein S4CHLAM6_03930 [Chlamydiae bacterium]|nr:hypothetical protein [Chlamydiota bacterium]
MTEMKQLLKAIISNPLQHARWLNTLSLMENCGAKLIAKSEHPTMVPKEILKHAAEEFRHAYFFKAQIEHVMAGGLKTYQLNELLGGLYSAQYLNRLNLGVSRFLTEKKINGSKLKEYSYLLVTYAIEIRAEKIYPIYQSILKEMGSKISILNIIRDEKHHLEEILSELEKSPASEWLVDVSLLEEKQFLKWKNSIELENECFENSCA